MNDMILILNFSSEFSSEIARRLRAEQIYAQIVGAKTTAQEIREIAPRGVILSGEALGTGGTLDAEILELGLPVLAMGHAAHLLLAAQGGACADAAILEKKAAMEYRESDLFAGITDGERYFKRAQTLMLPPEITETASAGGCTIAFEHTQKKQYGVQFELERNDPEGTAVLFNFACRICGCSSWWTHEAELERAQQMLSAAAAAGSSAICAVSGGVDSTVSALLAHRAFAERMKAVFVDTGLMREGEVEGIRTSFEELGIPLHIADRSDEILSKLEGKTGIDEKRAVVIESIDEAMLQYSASIPGEKTIVLGTNYSDYLDTGSAAAKWEKSGLAVSEPLLHMLKNEVREMAGKLGIGPSVVERKPFPALGLGARIVGEVTRERLEALRMAEVIFRREIQEAGLERKLYKYFPVMISDSVIGREMMILRAVTLTSGQLIPARLPYDLVERTVQSIMAAAPMISRVFYDQTPTAVGRETFA